MSEMDEQVLVTIQGLVPLSAMEVVARLVDELWSHRTFGAPPVQFRQLEDRFELFVRTPRPE